MYPGCVLHQATFHPTLALRLDTMNFLEDARQRFSSLGMLVLVEECEKEVVDRLEAVLNCQVRLVTARRLESPQIQPQQWQL